MKKPMKYVLRYPSGLYLASPIGASSQYTSDKRKATKLSLSSARYYASYHEDGSKNPTVEPMVSDRFDRYLHLVGLAHAKYRHEDGNIPMGTRGQPSTYAKLERWLFSRLIAQVSL